MSAKTGGSMAGTGEAASAVAPLRALVQGGIALLERERRLCRAGRVADLAALAAEKQALAARLAEGLAGLRAAPCDPARAALADDVAALARRARRNERLLGAVRDAGLAARRARRAGTALRRGHVGYGPDGRGIVSRADAAGPTRTA